MTSQQLESFLTNLVGSLLDANARKKRPDFVAWENDYRPYLAPTF